MATKYRINIRNPELLVEEIDVIKETDKVVWFTTQGHFEPTPFARISQYHEIFDRKKNAYLRLFELVEKKLEHAKAETKRTSRLLAKIKKIISNNL